MTHARRGRPSTALSVEILIESPLWKAVPSAKATVRRAIVAAAPPTADNAAIAILLTDDQSIRTLNRQWRGHDMATNVLSFPTPSSDRGTGTPTMLGDIAIAYETTAKEAAEEGKTFLHHLSHLAVHGLLHLVGYDHESHEEAEKMESLERRILARLGVPDPYSVRDAKA
jgi:probable rRNA maturation factor